jgi:uncharacterized protein (TIGR02453 family)
VTFTGIPIAALDFYEDLENDNSRSWWTAHRSTYDEAVKAPLDALVTALDAEFGSAKLFRPYRDIRFAKDKTPYKTHQGAWFSESARYVQVSAAGLFVAAGYWETSTPQVERLRRAVADEVAGAALHRAIAKTTKAGFALGGHSLTRVPAGFDKDHPRAELLRYKTLTVSREVGCPAWLSTSKAKAEIVKLLRAMAPIVDWLDTHVGRG